MRREEEIRKMLEETGPYFQLAPPKQECSEEGRLNETVRVLGERIDELPKSVCVCVCFGGRRRRERIDILGRRMWRRLDKGEAIGGSGSYSEGCVSEVQREDFEGSKTIVRT